MPTYEYKCPICNKIEIHFHKMEQTPKVLCVGCSNSEMQKSICSAVGLHFKGSGFYQTDYKNEKAT